jgi:hypothetical protein
MAIVMQDFENKHAYERAKKKAKEIRSFYINVTFYCITMPILIFINLRFTPEYYWFPFSMGGWGIGLLFHAMAAFDYMPFFNKDWEERKMKELLDKEKQKQQKFENKG